MGTISDWMAVFIPLAIAFAAVALVGRAMIGRRTRAVERRRREIDAIRLGDRGLGETR